MCFVVVVLVCVSGAKALSIAVMERMKNAACARVCLCPNALSYGDCHWAKCVCVCALDGWLLQKASREMAPFDVRGSPSRLSLTSAAALALFIAGASLIHWSRATLFQVCVRARVKYVEFFIRTHM